MDGGDEPEIFQGDPSYVDPTQPRTPHEDGDDRQDLIDQEIMARDTWGDARSSRPDQPSRVS